MLAPVRLFAVSRHHEAINGKASIFTAEHRIDINFRYRIIERGNHLRKAYKLRNHRLPIGRWLPAISVKQG